MATVKRNERFIPLKNYVITFVLIVGVIALVWYGFCWYKVIKEDKLSTSYLIKSKITSNEIKGLEGLDDVLTEAPSTYYLYISYTGSEKIYDMEKDLSKLINQYKIGDEVYFLNITDIKDKEDLIENLNKTLNLENKKIKQVPTIIYYADGKVIDIVEKENNNIMKVGDFQKLLDRNRIEKGQ